jgi:CIC family chloride channel protein
VIGVKFVGGGPGGIFAPMLVLGKSFGRSFGYFVQEVFPNFDRHAGAFAIAAMGALFAATVRAPPTGIVLVAERTLNFKLLPAMILTCVTASITAQSLGSMPVYQLLLARTLEADKAGTTA